MNILQTIKSHPIITGLIILVLVVVVYLIYAKQKGIVTMFSLTSNTPPDPPAHTDPDISWSVQSISGKSINYTISAGGGVQQGVATVHTNIGVTPLGSSGFYYSITGYGDTFNVAPKITMKIYHVESTPTIHYVEDKSVTAQF